MTAHLNAGETLDVELADGRTVHLYLHDCPNCTSIDMWTTRGKEVEVISADTCDTTRAPMGMYTMTGGQRETIERGRVGMPHTLAWPAVGTIVAVWNDR